MEIIINIFYHIKSKKEYGLIVALTNLIKTDIQDTLSESFLEYAGYNIQRRAIPDVRDGLRWGARQLLYSQMLGGFTYDKPFKKAIKSVSQAMGFCYVHGDASAYGTFIRMAKPFSYRYPLQEANGNYGTLINPDDHSASRYVELRGSKITAKVLEDIKKDTITEWEDTYDLEGQFPKVLPSKGIWLGINGCISIGSGMSCSIPPTNLREVNQVLINLIDNPNLSDDECICLPDFPTGATIINAEATKESMKNGTGLACKIRAAVEWDDRDRCLIVREMPYSTFTNTICKELASIMEEDEKCGIIDFKDYTGEKPDLRIYLAKKANPDKVLKMLYKQTSLETFFSINMVLLDHGQSPKVFKWKEMLQAHIDHEKEVYRRGFEYDLNKIENRIHIIDGILICLAQINQVVETIKSSASTAAASIALQRNYLLDAEQAKAVLDMKLSRLAHLEVKKLEDERDELNKKADHIKQILSNDELFKEELKNGWREVSKKFGDNRRTKIMDLGNYNDEQEEPVEEKSLIISLTNKNNLYVTETSSLYISRRAAAGNKIKLSSNECFISSISGNTTGESIFITKSGKIYRILNARLPINSLIDLNSLLSTKNYETFINVVSLNNIKQYAYLTIATSNGNIKKTLLNEYNNCRQGAVGIKLKENDEIVSVFLTNNEQIMCMSDDGYSIIFNSSEVSPGGKATQGVKAMTLRPGAHLSCAIPLDSTFTQVVFCTEKGKILRTKINEFSIQKRTGKGVISINLDKDDKLIDAALINERASDIILAGDLRIIRFPISSITVQSRGGKGIIGIKTKEITKINKILVE